MVLKARPLGERVGAALGIPVYLYEEAPCRRSKNLETHHGRCEALKEEIEVNPNATRTSDKKVGPAGATVIGARQPLGRRQRL